MSYYDGMRKKRKSHRHPDFIHASIHDFKTNISRYNRLIQAGRYRGVYVYHYETHIGIYMCLPKEERRETIPDITKIPGI